ncbi:MAG: phosphotransferase family protein [Firmicutes bacterium]|nr:phosphotransferase family protein [Bacillota bacterium]
MNTEERIKKELTRLCRITETITDQPVVKIERTKEGFTNHTYLVHLKNDEKVIIRVAGEGTEEYIDRKAENYNCCQMGFLGISPKVIYCNEETGNNINHFIPADTMTNEDFQESALLRGKAAALMRTYHQCELKFANNFSPINRIHECMHILADSGYVCEYDNYDELVRQLKQVETAISEAAIPTVPCHNDPLAANFLYDGDKMYAIDWEFSGMNDCFYDLAAFIGATRLSAEAEEQFLTCYCNHPPTDHERARLIINKFLMDAFEVYWAMMQLNAGKDHDTYFAFGKERIDRALSYTQDPFFEKARTLLQNK